MWWQFPRPGTALAAENGRCGPGGLWRGGRPHGLRYFRVCCRWPHGLPLVLQPGRIRLACFFAFHGSDCSSFRQGPLRGTLSIALGGCGVERDEEERKMAGKMEREEERRDEKRPGVERQGERAGSRCEHPKNKPPVRRRYGASVGCHDNIVQSPGAGCVQQRRLVPILPWRENLSRSGPRQAQAIGLRGVCPACVCGWEWDAVAGATAT